MTPSTGSSEPTKVRLTMRRMMTKFQTLKQHINWKVLQRVSAFMGARMSETHVPEVASSMTLTTMLSIVPLLAVSLAIFSAFPSFADTRQALEDMLFNSFLPSQYSEVIVGYLRSFSQHASGLGLFGLIGLAVTSIMLINNLFVTINGIFSITRPRPWVQRLLLYWALLTLGPLAMAFSITISTRFISSAAAGIEPSLLTYGLMLVQSILQTCAYAFLFRFVPNSFVKWTDAFVGALFVVIANLFVRVGFEHYVSAGTMGSIYGAFVAFPVLLLWIYIGWYLVFLGAAVTATMPLLTSGRFKDTYRVGNRFLTGVALLKVLTEERLANRPVVPLALLCESVGTYPQMARSILTQLANVGYCLESANGPSDKNPDWTLVADPHHTSLAKAVDVLLIDSENELVAHPLPKHGREEGVLETWFTSLRDADALAQPMAEVFTRGKAGTEAPRDTSSTS